MGTWQRIHLAGIGAEHREASSSGKARRPREPQEAPRWSCWACGTEGSPCSVDASLPGGDSCDLGLGMGGMALLLARAPLQAQGLWGLSQHPGPFLPSSSWPPLCAGAGPSAHEGLSPLPQGQRGFVCPLPMTWCQRALSSSCRGRKVFCLIPGNVGLCLISHLRAGATCPSGLRAFCFGLRAGSREMHGVSRSAPGAVSPSRAPRGRELGNEGTVPGVWGSGLTAV